LAPPLTSYKSVWPGLRAAPRSEQALVTTIAETLNRARGLPRRSPSPFDDTDRRGLVAYVLGRNPAEVAQHRVRSPSRFPARRPELEMPKTLDIRQWRVGLDGAWSACDVVAHGRSRSQDTGAIISKRRLVMMPCPPREQCEQARHKQSSSFRRSHHTSTIAHTLGKVVATAVPADEPGTVERISWSSEVTWKRVGRRRM
jgi:hypothetical protein